MLSKKNNIYGFTLLQGCEDLTIAFDVRSWFKLSASKAKIMSHSIVDKVAAL